MFPCFSAFPLPRFSAFSLVARGLRSFIHWYWVANPPYSRDDTNPMNVEEWPHIEELFHDALALPIAERAAYLRQACGVDSSLYNEVESLLAAHGHAEALGACVTEMAAEWAAHAHPRIGQTIGRYRIDALLGAGGMGEVFLAEDVQLHRHAALKILPERFTADAARVRRFEQETRAVLALNHPNIVTLFDLGQADGAYYMATEYVEGETLRARLQREGALPAREALEIALQIAAALTAAHAAGIIHRDIKPENVMIRRDGYVKVLDFGLAKVTEAAHLDDTDSSSLTESGAVMGTARYMSPEQARGLRVDARSDLFSLAVVLYEMLAGRAPFTGETRGDLLVSILTIAPPPLVETAPATPVVIETILLKALAKESDARYATVDEFAAALKVVAAELAYRSRDAQALPLVTAPVNAPAPRRRLFFLLSLTAALAVAGVIGWLAFRQTRSRFETDLLAQLKPSLVTSWQAEPDSSTSVLNSSSDGKFLALARSQNGQVDIYVQQLNGGQPRKVTDDVWTDRSPIWSPDNQQLAYLSQRQEKTELWVIPSFGGSGQLLATLEAAPRWLTSWSRDGQRIYYEAGSHLYTVDVPTKEIRRVTDFLSGRAKPLSFAVSADDQWLVFAERIAGVQQLFVVALAGGTPTQITHEGEANDFPLWMPDGERVLYGSQRNGVPQICVAYRDGSQPVQITFGHEPMMPWDVSQNGQTIFYRALRAEADVYLLDVTTGVERQIISGIKPKSFPAFAPDGKALVWQQANDREKVFASEIFASAFPDGEPLRLTDNGFDPRWSPLGDRLAFLRRQGGAYQLWTVRRDGANARALNQDLGVIPSLAMAPLGWNYSSHYSWSPDGQRLLYGGVRQGVWNLFISDADGQPETPLTQNTDARLRLLNPLWTPDGRQVVYQQRQVVAAGLTPPAIYLHDGARQRLLWQANEPVRLLGWLPDGARLLVAVTQAWRPPAPALIKLMELSLTGQHRFRPVALTDVYFTNVVLAPHGRQVAYVTRQNHADNVWLWSLEGGQPRKLTSHTDPNRNLGCLVWSPQANQLCYLKQSDTISIYKIENFQ
jgi:Tol biopolymer transport system component